MRPLLSYYGGKQRLASRIVALVPPHTVYVEPFCGGAAVLFAKPRPLVTNQHHYREVLNDHDEALINVYRCCQDPVTRQALYDRLQYTPYSRAEHARAKDIWRQPQGHDAVTRAWAMVVTLQQSFSHSAHSGWKTSVCSKNDATTAKSWRVALETIIERLQAVYLECDDALAVIRRWDSPQTCVYADPPYVGADQDDYRGYTAEDWAALVDVLETCQSSVVLSSYAQDREPRGPGWERLPIHAYCSASGQGQTNGHDRTRKATAVELGARQRTEVLWRIDRSATVRQELAWMRTPQGELFAPADEL